MMDKIRHSHSFRWTRFFERHWFFFFSLGLGFYVGLPFLAPVFMKIGWTDSGRVIYFIYSWLCHQLPERSFFLFGPKMTYSLAEVQSAWQNTLNPMILRRFTGSPGMGWKVAWSDRMVWMFTSAWLFALLWWPLRRRVKPLPWWGVLPFLLPLILDGTTHMISDLYGVEQGFRDTNAWLAVLTGQAFSASFYAGAAWGSFNSWARLVSGIIFGLGIVWFGCPLLEHSFSSSTLPGTGSTLSPSAYPQPELNTNIRVEKPR